MDVKPTALPEVLLIDLDVFTDARGFFCERFHEERFAKHGLPTKFRQDNQSRSRKGVLRGLHYQLTKPQGKLLSCVRGAIFDVAVDLRVGSPSFSKWVGIELSGENAQLLWIPPGFAHGFLSLSDDTEVQYKCTELYAPSDERGILWSDPELGIRWPVTNPILSERDLGLSTLAAVRMTLPRYQGMTVRDGAR